MASEHIIRVTFSGSENGNGASGNNLTPNLEKPQIGLEAVGGSSLLKSVTGLYIATQTAKTISSAVSVSNQVSGASMYQNNLNMPIRAFGKAAALTASGAFGAVQIGLELEQYRAEIDKEEKKQNNLRAIVGLEATNNSRYGGQRR